MLSKVVPFLLILAMMSGAAWAQDTIGLYADFGDGDGLARALVPKVGEPFDVVVVMKADSGSEYIEFVMTELAPFYSGVFKYSTTRINGVTVDLGNDNFGGHAFGFGSCVDSGEHEVLRVRYFDVDGSLEPNVVLSLRPFEAADGVAAHFEGTMGYSDCAGRDVALAPEPWDGESGFDPTRIAGLESTDGILVLNPDGLTVAAGPQTIGLLKGRFH